LFQGDLIGVPFDRRQRYQAPVVRVNVVRHAGVAASQ
jgi:hypothetical protein